MAIGLNGELLLGSDVTVLDLTTSVAGGFCAALLARMGADVSRVEGCQGNDVDRDVYAYLHAAKRRITLSVDADEDSAVRELTERSNVVLIDTPLHASLAGADGGTARVIVDMTVGARELQAESAAADLSLWASTGLLDLARGGGGEPVLPPAFLASYYVGLHGAVASVAAVMEVRATGETVSVGVNAIEVLSTLLLETAALEPNADIGIVADDGARSWMVHAADGDVLLNLSSVYISDFLAFARGWGLVAASAGVSDTKLCESAARAMRRWSRAEIIERVQEWRIPAGAVLSLGDLEHDEQIRHRGILKDVSDPELGASTIPWLPWLVASPDNSRLNRSSST